METKKSVYEMVTERIISELEKGIIPWHKPWNCASGEIGAISYSSRKPYSWLNQMMLGKAGEWLTYNQITSLNGTIKKGEKSSMVVFWKNYEFEEENEDGEMETKSIPMLRYYNVWHIDQCEGIQSKIKAQGDPEEKPAEPKTLAEPEAIIKAYVERSGLKFINDKQSNQAFYSPSCDEVVVPTIGQYKEVAEYYSTTFHELVHSTGNAKRLNRANFGTAHFGDKNYSREELVAEIGSAMLCNHSGIDCEKAFKNSVAYIQSWAEFLKKEPKAIVFASSQAEKASKYILDVKE